MELKVIELRTADVFQDMVRVHRIHRPAIPAGRIFRVRHVTKSVLLVARGARANQRNTFAIDLKTRQALGIPRYGEDVEVTFSNANPVDELVWGWRASEPVSRIASRLGLLSVVLGAIGAVLGAWSLWLTMSAPPTSRAMPGAEAEYPSTSPPPPSSLAPPQTPPPAARPRSATSPRPPPPARR